MGWLVLAVVGGTGTLSLPECPSYLDTSKARLCCACSRTEMGLFVFCFHFRVSCGLCGVVLHPR